ncbi:helix-turn-helix domain-containing protein [Devosia rhizoryzae]|uniref:Helix-turn-helix transcriptional regulator n=1 Tax=Devosia rhizoryzae TaxID=2774137 RepID=A0ABX7C8Z0_9HYPH|nr:helix-turn-helix transcriptional regulator [Devosia rhizoryzae]QQR39055.1 helix-turn-helix transcriptional regulator [Devosia rhizoryzae]
MVNSKTIEHFKDRLKGFREEKFGWTQAELADRARLSVVTISKLEQGKNLPTFEVLVGLCEALSISPNELIGWKPQGSAPGASLMSERLAVLLKRLPQSHSQALVEFAEKLAKGS